MRMRIDEALRVGLPIDLQALLETCPEVSFPRSREELIHYAFGRSDTADSYDVGYDIPGQGFVVEATLARCRNGVAVNYTDPYMRRRDPDCMVIGDDGPTDKERFRERFGKPFDGVRRETLAWLREQRLIVLFFYAGGKWVNLPSVLVAPENAAFFALALADLQGFVPPDEVDESFEVRSVIYLAPPFRLTHFGGEQVVVHNRLPDVHEIFSYNLYPGPSAKKGVYGALLALGEDEGWLTNHAATVQLITPYDNIFTIMHEGASGSGKSEILEEIHRQADGRILVGENLVTGEDLVFSLGDTCKLRRVTDDMALAHPAIQTNGRKLWVTDAEHGWFLRIDHITEYGTAPLYERLTIHPSEPLLFINIRGVPGATCLIWEHTEDSPGKPCPNPRVILPRAAMPDVVDEPVAVDIRSFGIRTPPCTREHPTYGIVGMMHILPPALAWLWRLVAPRGYANPSITDSQGLQSEGVGSYWPFATGRRVRHANLLLQQIRSFPGTRYTLFPNQHIGAWRVGFMPEWLGREYLARRGTARFRPEQLVPSRCPLLGYALNSLRVDGNPIPIGLLQVDRQPEVGQEGFDAGAAILQEFFAATLQPYLEEDLDPLGRRIIESCLEGADLETYERLLPME